MKIIDNVKKRFLKKEKYINIKIYEVFQFNITVFNIRKTIY